MDIEIGQLVTIGFPAFTVGLTIGYWLGIRNPQITEQAVPCPVAKKGNCMLILKNGNVKTVICPLLKKKDCSLNGSRCHFYL